jgi:hypothetical protein
MKKLALIILLLGLPAFATDYTVTTSANQDTILERARLRSNAAICIAVGLPTSCTRAQAIAKDPVVGADYANAISNYVNKLVKANIQLDRKVLADLAVNDPAAFGSIVAKVKAQLA